MMEVGTMQVEMRKWKHEKWKTGVVVEKMGRKSHENSQKGTIAISRECPLFIVKAS